MFRTITVIDKADFIQPEVEVENEEDKITVDVPLLIRLLEYAREDVKDDVTLHNVATRMIELSEKGDYLTMEHYAKIVGKPTIMTEKTMDFRMDSRTLWSRFAWSLLNYSIALNSDIDGKEQAEARIYSHAAKIGNFVEPYYGKDNATAVASALTEFGRLGVMVMQDLKAGKPLDGTKALWDANINDIATFLSSLNPEYWPYEAVKSYFDTLVTLWIDSIRSRNERNWAANETAIDNIDKLVTTGNGVSSSLADVFSSGILMQQPEKFYE